MSEHYPKNTTGVMKFCNRCGKKTMHKVSGKKLGLCTEDHHAGKIEPEKQIDVSERGLFDV